VEAALHLAPCDGRQGWREISKAFAAVDPAGSGQRGDAAICRATLVVTCKVGFLSIESDGANQVFDPSVLDLDAAIRRAGLQSVPMIMGGPAPFFISFLARTILTAAKVRRSVLGKINGRFLKITLTPRSF